MSIGSLIPVWKLPDRSLDKLTPSPWGQNRGRRKYSMTIVGPTWKWARTCPGHLISKGFEIAKHHLRSEY
ncbi:uncharacterized protein N7473_005064 [Penicillium subrubescens]|uniref:uncharacterized protein n=1 Tax=Penicillium subrubescens TaxID=1316194 RepID=UPI002545A51E|nr:uncharacterized protein N7473_005064 [Penicillium subrubescens]KAJ5900994.1 hypothetical protein N7473_005064 [Penicillium subrubescens]